MQDRIYWVDYAKCIGIILVVYAHVSFGLHRAGIISDALFNAPFMIIAVNTMPWFFFLSGLFFTESISKRGQLGFVANKIDTLIYPYIVWSLIQGVIEFVFNKWTNAQIQNLNDVVILLWQPRAQFWFLYCLFFINLFALILNLFIKSRILLLVVSLLAYLLSINVNFGYTVANQITGYLFYFVLAICLKDKLDWAYENRKVLLMPALIMTVAIHWLFYPNFESAKQLHGYWQFLITLLSIPCIIIFTMSITHKIPMLLYIGKNSIAIYLAHIIAGSGTRIILHKWFGIDNLYIHIIFGMTAGVFFPLLMCFIFQRIGANFLFKIPKRLSIESFFHKYKAHLKIKDDRGKCI